MADVRFEFTLPGPIEQPHAEYMLDLLADILHKTFRMDVVASLDRHEQSGDD